MNSHELSKLKKLAESSSNTESINIVQDVTDILKNMIVEVKENRILTFLESISLFFKNTFANNVYLHYLVAGLVIVRCSSIFNLFSINILYLCNVYKLYSIYFRVFQFFLFQKWVLK